MANSLDDQIQLTESKIELLKGHLSMSAKKAGQHRVHNPGASTHQTPGGTLEGEPAMTVDNAIQ